MDHSYHVELPDDTEIVVREDKSKDPGVGYRVEFTMDKETEIVLYASMKFFRLLAAQMHITLYDPEGKE